MKPIDINVRYRAFRIIAELVRAERALDDARQALIAAELEISDYAPAAVSEWAYIKESVVYMRRLLYADVVSISNWNGGDMLAWDLRSLALRVGSQAVQQGERAE